MAVGTDIEFSLCLLYDLVWTEARRTRMIAGFEACADVNVQAAARFQIDRIRFRQGGRNPPHSTVAAD